MVEFDNPEIRSLFEKIRVFEKMYEIIRFVDPLRKKVIDYKQSGVFKGELSCFDFWDRGGICDNCISMRAYNENETFIKLEFNHSGIYMVTAVPIELDDRKIVIELLKDATDSMVIQKGDEEKGVEIHSIIRKINSLIFKDALTGIYNRKYIDERLPVDVINASIQSHQLSVILADLDNFNKFNEKYGKMAGDQVIIQLTECVKNSIRKDNDWAARFEDDKFLICLSNTNKEKAFEIADLIRKNLEDTDIKFGDKLLKATASFGIFNLEPGKYVGPKELIEYADKNLNKAKTLGKNRVCV